MATHLVGEGVSVGDVQGLLCHARLSTTAGYLAVSEEELRQAVQRLR
ncbi:MAG: hypothetical protein JKY65_29955 [Planctomycetes bacterium]|nr:hypothetical protein [Planctomycetota bacterium]